MTYLDPNRFWHLKTKVIITTGKISILKGPNSWSYSFDKDNILIDQISNIGVASNTIGGLTEIVTYDTNKQKFNQFVLNR